ncbi:TPA: hypothetical protein ACS4NL_004820 [Klebsiella oxytoca]
MKIPILALLYVLRLSGALIPVLALADKIFFSREGMLIIENKIM